MSKPAPPQPPNPQQVAQAQTGSNIGTAIANSYMGNANTYGPLGSTTYNQTGNKNIKIGGKTYGIPTWEVNQKLSPDQMRLLNLQEATSTELGETGLKQAQKIGGLLGTSINPDRLPDDVRNAANAPQLQYAQGLTPNYQQQVGANDFSADREKVENAIMSRLNPQISQDRTALQARLANQGVTQGSSAYNNAIDELNRQVTDQRMAAVLAGGQEQSRMFDMDVTKGQFANNVTQQEVQDRLRQADSNNQVRQSQFSLNNTEQQNQQTLRQQALQEQIALRNQPIAEISALMNGSQPTMPTFQQFQAGQIAPTPVGQYMYQTAALNQQNYAQQNSQYNAMLGGISGMGGSALSSLPFLFSDKRLKEDIKKVGKADNGLPIFSYRYKDDPTPRIGFMAQDVEKVHPDAVATHSSGFKMVDYGKAVQPVEH